MRALLRTRFCRAISTCAAVTLFATAAFSSTGVALAASPASGKAGSLSAPAVEGRLATGADFIRAIDDSPVWNRGRYCFFVNDCHNQLEAAFADAGVAYPGAPEGRVVDPHFEGLAGYAAARLSR